MSSLESIKNVLGNNPLINSDNVSNDSLTSIEVTIFKIATLKPNPLLVDNEI